MSAAEPIVWDYIPSKRNLCSRDESFSDDQIIHASAGVGSKYKKAVYREYQDATFAVSSITVHKPRTLPFAN